ncbi:MAG: tRNA lysidine(34) synthetase TilS [Nitrospirae bacterium]|nr:tRNA lysidine(34) synthetase TilS [Nitrospirota bacterium]
MRLARHVLGTLRAVLPESGATVLVAVSGGVDSVVLLHLLHGMAGPLRITLHAAHLNHALRGAEADRDQACVADLCTRLGVPLHTATIKPERRPGESPQAAARRVRYGFLGQAAAACGATHLATAHHRDDLAETVLMRLLAGAGLAGLAGMAGQAGAPGLPVGVTLIRPLLDIPKADLLAHARARAIPFGEDASNQSPRYPRNRVRRDLLPALEAVYPGAAATLARQAALLADEDALLARLAEDAAARVVTRDGADLLLDRGALAALHPALARRVLHRLLAARLARPASAHVAAVLALAAGPSGRATDLPHGLTAVAEAKLIRIAAGPPPTAPAEGGEVTLALPGITPLPWAGLAIEARPAPAMPEGDGWLLFTVDGPLTARPRRPGDRFCPAGMGGHSQTLKDFLISRKVPRRARDRVALLCADGALLWVAGLRADGRRLAAAPGPGVVAVRITPAPG